MTVTELAKELLAAKETASLLYQLGTAAEAVRDAAEDKESLTEVYKLAEFVVDEVNELIDRLEATLD